MKKLIAVLAITSIIIGCSAPRNISHSSKVLEPGKWSGSVGMYGNFGTAPIGELGSTVVDQIKSVNKKDTFDFKKDIKNPQKAITAYSLDPIGVSSEVSVHYGLLKNLEVGYRYAGLSIYEVYYQLYHDDESQLAMGIQYSSDDYTLPSYLGKF